MITPQEFIKLTQSQNILIIDVRNHDEYVHKHIPDSKNIPLDEILDRSHEIPQGTLAYFVCQCGNRSAKAIEDLQAMGHNNLVNVLDGIEGYEKLGGKLNKISRAPTLMRQAQIFYGFFILLGIILAMTIQPHFIWLSVVFGAFLLIAGISGFCLITAALIHLPWNKAYQVKKGNHD